MDAGAGRRVLAWLRARFRASEGWFILLAVAVGSAAGLLAVAQAFVAHRLQSILYGFDETWRLSALPDVPWTALLWLPAGGLILGLTGLLLARWRPRPLIDVVEANALYGGRLSIRDSLAVCLQTLISNGFGASVGLEAAYAQAGGAAASALGQQLKLRRQDLRTLVGAGAGAAIGAAFGAPLAGAFYAFEIVIGSYAPSMIAPVAAASLASVLVARATGAAPYVIDIAVLQAPQAADYLLYGGLGAVCAIFGIALMRLVGLTDRLVRKTGVPAWLRPAIGGALVAVLAWVSPQVLSSGHGALHLDLAARAGL
jgi:CIC family chloride channel protein